MKQELKFVNFFNSSLLKGYTTNLKVCNNSLKAKNKTGYSGYFSKTFNTSSSDMTFNRMLLDADFSDCKTEIIISAFNSDTIVVDDDFVEIDSYLADKDISDEEKISVLKSFSYTRIVNAKDILLYDIKGRYVVVYIGVYTKKESDFTIRGFRVEFPKMSFSEYFPEIYRNNGDFFEKYISLYQSMYLDEEKKIDRIPALLDYETTPDNFVEELASWIGIDNKDNLFTPEQLRYLIKNSDFFQGKKGTAGVLSRLIELYTGQKPIIVEFFKWYYLMKKNKSLTDQYKKLYGDGGNHFAVIIDTLKLKREIDEKKLKKLISSNIPMGSKFNLILLEKCNHTDMNCYLDVNSYISTPKRATSDGIVLGGNLTIG